MEHKNLILNGETAVDITQGKYRYANIKNLTAGNAIAGFEKGLTDTSETAWVIPAGNSVQIPIPTVAKKVYINATGKIQFFANSNVSECPFKSASASGGGSVTYTATLTDGKECGKIGIGGEETSIYCANYDSDISDIKSYIGLYDDDVVGLCVDYENKTFDRLAGAKGLSAGTDFDKFAMYGGRRRCNVSDDGTINAYYGDAGYVEDGSNGQVMVYQPKFYYKVVPVKVDKQSTGIGYHMRKANYYVSQFKREGFKIHPAFVDKNGKETDYVLMSAFEGCIYDTSASAYLLNDEQVADFSDDKLSSIAGARPASGLSQNLTRPNVEALAQKRGSDWHSLGIKTASMEQLLMMIELGSLNVQTAIGMGVVSISGGDSSQSNASRTGSTVGNGTGNATSTIDYAGNEQTESGKVAVSYRGLENFWGNIWKFVIGVNIWGNGSMGGGQPYICSDFTYAESKNSGNYEGAGFCVTNANGYISAFGYSEKFDWLFIASETLGNSSLPVGDYTYVMTNLNGYKSNSLGGVWGYGTSAGVFCHSITDNAGNHHRAINSRLVYIPTSV